MASYVRPETMPCAPRQLGGNTVDYRMGYRAYLDATELGIFGSRSEAARAIDAAVDPSGRLTPPSPAAISRAARSCEHCGDPIPDGRRRDARFCSAACGWQARPSRAKRQMGRR